MKTTVRMIVAALAATLLASCGTSDAGDQSPVTGGSVVDDAPLNVQMDDAIKAGNLTLVEAILEEGFGINDEVKEGATILHLAAMRNQVEIAEYVIAEGADLMVCNGSGNTPLMDAARLGDGSVAQVLLDAGACPCFVNEKMCCGNTALHIAARMGNAATTRVLLGAGTDPNIVDTGGNTPLTFAALSGEVEIAEMLIEAGAEINPVNGNGWTPLDWAKYNGHDDVAALLEAAGATE